MSTDAFAGPPATIQGTGWSPVPFTHVTIDDTFWAPRIATNRDHTLPHAYQLCLETGRIDAFRLTWRPGQAGKPHIFWDSDVAKWIEAASYSLATHPDPTLAARVDEVIELIATAQQPDGYVNPYFTVVAPEQRWTNLRDWHELYCAGHLIEAAVAHFQATDKRTLLDVMCRYVDYIATVFGPEPGQKRGYDGHEEIELALVKLYQVTNERRYLDLALYFVEERGCQPHFFDEEARARGEDPADFEHGTYEYNQAHQPVREQTQVVGHAVRAVYLYAALADLAREYRDESLLATCQRLWDHLTTTRMYVTGGIGTSRHNEGFTADYDLPNTTAYAETCAAIGLVLWAHRMLQLDCAGQYADIMELALYNGVLSGVARDGMRFFYDNPLASAGGFHRKPWYDVSCCPTNIARLLPSLGQHIYTTNETEIAAHLYIQNTATLTVGPHTVTLRQATRYPWDGAIAFTVNPEQPTTFRLRLRLPGWNRQARVTINGRIIDHAPLIQAGYIVIEREWQAGDEVSLDLAMPVERRYAHPHVTADIGRVALQRGPLVYCLEALDNDVAPDHMMIPTHATFAAHFDPNLLGGVVTLHGDAIAEREDEWDGTLYRIQPPATRSLVMTAIPYHVWDNRAPGAMAVWLRETRSM